MSYIGKQPAAVALTASDITDGIISTAKVADAGITNAKLAADIISGDTALGAAPADTDELLVSDAGVLKKMDYSYIKAVNTPAFLAYQTSGQGISSDTATKAQLGTEVYDTDSTYDHSSNYRWTPAVAGTYQVQFALMATGSSLTRIQPFIYKNGSAFARIETYYDTVSRGAVQICADIVLDGDDYLEFFAHITGSSPTIDNGSYYTWASGFKLIT